MVFVTTHFSGIGISMREPGYLQLYKSDELRKRIQTAEKRLAECKLCPRRCKVNRLKDERGGVCRTGRKAIISSYSPHFGEESPLVGRGGSGTIFITNCNLGCLFCQNYEISHLGEGMKVTDQQMAAIMIDLQNKGCNNINFVTPSHVVPQILAALPLAVEEGLTLPLVYNTSGYDEVETLRLLDGVFDIYMPDFKFWHKKTAKRYAGAPNYPERTRRAIKEMHRQVGDLVMDERGIAARGLLVRHLVMPAGLDETAAIMRFLADEISRKTYVNVMEQYRPCGQAHNVSPINRSLTYDEYEEALKLARQAGLTRLDDRNVSRLFQQLGFF